MVRPSVLTAVMSIAFVVSGCVTDVQQTKRQTTYDSAFLILNSQPPVIRVWAGGEYRGTTPMELSYNITPFDRARGFLLTSEFVFAQEGYLPIRKDYRLDLGYSSPPGKDEYFSDLVLLKRDPFRTRGAEKTDPGEEDVATIQEEGSSIDQAVKAGKLELSREPLTPSQ